MAEDSTYQRAELDVGVSWSATETVANALVVTLEPVEGDTDDVVQYALTVENIADVEVAGPVQFDVAFEEISDVHIESNADWECEHRDGVVSCVTDEDFEAAAVSVILMSTSTKAPAQTAQLTLALLGTLLAGLGVLAVTRRRHARAVPTAEGQ